MFLLRLKIYVTLLFCLSSCSWGRKNAVLNAPPEKDLVEVFELQGKEFDKFKETSPNVYAAKKTDGDLFSGEEGNAPSIAVIPPAPVEATPEPTPLPLKEPAAVSSKSKKKNNKKSTEKVTVEKSSSPETPYPADYPAEYKNYDSKYAPLWRLARPHVLVGEKMVIDVKYFGVTAGRIALETLPAKRIGEHEAYHFHAKLQSAPFYRYIYSLEDFIESYVGKANFLPLKYMLVQRETNQDVDDLQLFDYEKSKTFFWYKRVKKKDEHREDKENKEDFIPRYVQDSFSALFFIRGLPFNVGDTYEFPIVTRAKIWILKAQVAGIEKVTVAGQEYEAYKLKAETHYPGVLKKKGDVVFWFSTDHTRRILRFEGKVKIGTIEGELVSYSYEP